MKKRSLLCLLLLLAIVLSSALATKSFAIETAVSCWKTTIGNPQNPPVPPPGCNTTIDGLEFPPNMECFAAPAEESGGKAGEYCKMPTSKEGYYAVNGTPWGSKEMIGTLYTVAKKWKENHKSGKLYIGDITAAGGHTSHFWGIAVDLTATTNGNDIVSNMERSGYNRGATIELANLLVDTGYMDTIWYNDSAVQKAMCEHAHTTFPKRFPSVKDCYDKQNVPGMRWLRGHGNHFHLNIDRAKNYSLSSSRNLDKSKLRRCGNGSRNVC